MVPAGSAVCLRSSFQRCVGLGLLLLHLGLPASQAWAAAPQLTQPVQQVQLDVVLARVRRGLAHHFVFLKGGRSNQGQLLCGVLDWPRGTDSFLGFLRALEKEGVVKVVAQPRLVTLSGNRATFLDGGARAVPVPDGSGQVGVQFEEFGTRLNFLPIVLGNGKIHLEVEPEVSTLDPNARRATQRIHTTVQLESGQTFVIGGLIQKTITASTSTVPIVGELPYVGALFSTRTCTADEAELVVLVTPRLVDTQQPGQTGEGRLERRLQKLQADVDDLQRELRSLRRARPDSGER
jgi:Flp pilus assembly secretin CpaC